MCKADNNGRKIVKLKQESLSDFITQTLLFFIYYADCCID